MKHTLETKNQFIELRAQGLALDAISEQIGIPKATLGRWNQECLDQIQRLRAIQWELVEDQMGQRFEDSLKRIAQRIRRLEDELDTRKPQHFARMELVRVIRQSRLEYLKLRSILMAPLQPTRRRTPCLGDLDPQKRDKTVQNTDSLDTTSLQQNDLQQSEPALSHSSAAYGVSASAGQASAESNDSQISKAASQAIPGAAETQSLGENDDPKLGQREGGIPVPPIAPTERNRTQPNDLAGAPYGVPASAGQTVAESNDSQISNALQQAVPSPGGEGKGEGGIPVAACDRPKKHKPYWLNGIYYANPALPYHVARAMIRQK